ncbi:MAG: hypothetical protein WCQ77_14625 [Planctomycetota bacterium]
MRLVILRPLPPSPMTTRRRSQPTDIGLTVAAICAGLAFVGGWF